MKKFILILVSVIIVIFIYSIYKKGQKTDPGRGTTSINGYQGVVEKVNGNVLDLTSGLHARLIGTDGRSSVEMFLRGKYVGKRVTLYTDSHSRKQNIMMSNDTVDVYAIETGTLSYCINRLAVLQDPESYHPTEALDSTTVEPWVSPDTPPVPVGNLALYMKPRTFLIATPDGIGTGFFISETGLAVTNWHVLPPSQERNSQAYLYQDDPNDSQIYNNKKRNIKNILWSSDMNGLDITIFSVDLENAEKVPFFKIAKCRPIQGDQVSTYGNPHGLTASFSQGVVSAFRSDPYNPNRNVQLVQYDMATNGGNSGGPVCDKFGQIVAVHELGDKSLQNVNYGIDAMQLRQVLDQLKVNYGGR